MVTFNCEVCNDTVPKKNTEKHYYRCPQAYYTCIDCNQTFDDGISYKKHIQCITEDEKYQKGLYKGKKNGNQNDQNGKQPNAQVKKEVKVEKKEEKPVKKESKPEKKDKKDKKDKKSSLIKGESLYKILKSINNKDDKKELLKRLIVTAENKIELQ
ncbi:uncharacterized protein KLLA0_F10219g [Kluyveromyces lactis]|uniref:KLLA0F10219p n=1 Tax=Kluyveromyces lactis (strain ATCC 8585 / CBS 2359 / DSM 70799 / NBRC 1267 / NRRL Y-1140 / WM37) TaxID=284590 RepID=Q6CKJ4_KLULA|nr:uncharacterized protein KLLA0_F10219g [Kluyveromyces lactis]CAG98253.1 KLLA0F10219p [Kluyveromyces lactis]|eukprot:XP_455545.1 uncharacterized protein KLLA0_F10219g [Kluyveromyces lactis]